MKKILITGTSGNVGSEVLKAFSDDAQFSCRILLRKKHSNLRLAKKVATNVEVIWGDLQNLDDCKNFIVESDYVFHIAGIIPPQADHFPEETYKTNVGGTKNLLQAVQEKLLTRSLFTRLHTQNTEPARTKIRGDESATR